MLAVAKDLAPAVDWRQGAAESMPFPDQSFDTVVSQFGLMFFVDRLQALREMLRVMTPTGCLVVVVWDSLDNILAYSAEVALLERLAGTRAADAVRAPFVLGNPQNLATLFKDAGAASVEIKTRQGSARFPSVRVMVEAELRGWLPAMGVLLTEDQISRVLEEAEDTFRSFVTTDGGVTFDVAAHLVTAKKS